MLAAAGYIDGQGILKATDAGRAALPDAEALPQGPALQEHWLTRLPAGEAKILRELLDARGELVTRERLMESTQYAVRSLQTYLPKMVAKGIAVTERGGVRAAESLF